MDKIFLKDAFGWGIGLWFIGYVLGIILFMLVPANMIGWVISPVGIAITLWVLLKKTNGDNMIYYLKIAFAWTAIAVVFDYLFLVLLFNPAGGYYKLDVYFYYTNTFVLPLIVGIFKVSKQKKLSGGADKITGYMENQQKEKVEHKQKILDMFLSRDKIANKDVERELNVSDSTATRYLGELEKEGKIRQVGGEDNRYTYYEKI